jgi:hypothetical protein
VLAAVDLFSLLVVDDVLALAVTRRLSRPLWVRSDFGSIWCFTCKEIAVLFKNPDDAMKCL